MTDGAERRPVRSTQPLQLVTADRGPARVLVVEDSADMARLVRAIVEGAGHQVLETVPNGEAALGLAPQADVVLLDYQLDGGLTGLDVLREIRHRRIAVSVVLMTGHGSERVAAEALRLGADDYVTKDQSFVQMLPAVLQRALRIREVERALEESRAQVVRAERRVAIGEVVVAISHEMNNPLMALRAELELLRLEGARLPPEAQGRVEAAIAQVDRISAVLRRVAEHDRETSKTYVRGIKMTDLGGS